MITVTYEYPEPKRGTEFRSVWDAADACIPSDVREFGERHGMPELANELWRAAFISGWRHAKSGTIVVSA